MRLLDLFCGAGGSAAGYARAGFEVVGVEKRVDNRPLGMVECLYGQIRERSLSEMREGKVSSDPQRDTYKPALSSVRNKTSDGNKTEKLGESRTSPEVARGNSHRQQRVSFGRRPSGQPVSIYGRRERAGI